MGPPRELHAATTHSGREYRNNNSDPLSSAGGGVVHKRFTKKDF